MNIEDLVWRADAVGIKLELTAGIPTWEPLGVARHQKALTRIGLSISPGFWPLPSVYIRFPDSSLKRPDMRIEC